MYQGTVSTPFRLTEPPAQTLVSPDLRIPAPGRRAEQRSRSHHSTHRTTRCFGRKAKRRSAWRCRSGRPSATDTTNRKPKRPFLTRNVIFPPFFPRSNHPIHAQHTCRMLNQQFSLMQCSGNSFQS